MILHICCNLAGSTVFPRLFEALAAKGVDQMVFVPEKDPANLGKNMPAGVPVLQLLTVRKSDALFFSQKAKRSAPAIHREIDLSRVSFVCAHTLFTDGSIALALGLPYGVTLRYSDTEAIWRYEPHLRPLGRKIMCGARYLAFLSAGVRDRVLEKWFTSAERKAMRGKSVVIPNGIDPDWLGGTPREAVGDTVRVGFAGLLNRRKRPLDALAAVHLASQMEKSKITGRSCGSGKAHGNNQTGSAMAIVSEAGAAEDRFETRDKITVPRFVLDLCGAGPLEGKLKAKIAKGDRMLGALCGIDAMRAFYRDIDILLVPSTAESFGMVYLEAMSQGVPVLYSRGQGFDGQFPDGTVGYAVIPGDTHDQAQRLIDVVHGDYTGMSARCVSLANGFAWPKIADRWMGLLRCYLPGKGFSAEKADEYRIMKGKEA